MSYTVHEAKTNLSRLIKEAESGKEVIITRGKEPVAKIIPIRQDSKEAHSGQYERPVVVCA
jgi:prevent-host-death family protein